MISDYIFLISLSIIVLLGLFVFFTRYFNLSLRNKINYFSVLYHSIKDKKDVSLLIDIDNGSINIAIVSFVKNQVPEFLYSANTSFVKGKLDISELSNKINLLLDSLLKVAIKEGSNNSRWRNKNKKFSRVVISLSSPWLTLKQKDIHLSKDIPFIITKKFIDNITSNEEKLFKKELLKDFSVKEYGQFEIVEKSIIHAKINGYTVDDVINKKTKNLDAYLYMSAISQKVEENISDIVLKHTHISKENILIHSFPLVLFSTVRDNFMGNSDFIIININSEVTDIILVNDHIIKSTASFPFGKNTIIRQIAKSFKVSMEIAQSELNMYLSKKIDNEIYESIQSLMEDLEKEWSIYFEDALLTLSPNMILPKKIFMTTDAEVSSIFMDFLKPSRSDATFGFRKSIEVVHVDEATLSGSYQNNFKIPISESTIILAIFHNKLIRNQ